MANTTTTVSANTDEEKTSQERIEDQYANLLKSQTATMEADYQNTRSGYESQLAKSDATYQPLRNEAYVNTALAERARKENMANMGLSGEGGTSLSLQQRNTGNLLSTLGDISLGQQSYEDEINLALANLDTTYTGNVDSVTADVEAQRIAALLAQDQYDQSYGLSEAQLKLSQGDALAAQVLSLYDNKLITKKQAQQYLDFSSETGFDEFFNKYYGLA